MVAHARDAFSDLGFQIVEGARYLGGHVGTKASEQLWVRGEVGRWSLGLTRLAAIARSSPQMTYAAVMHSFQHEWQYLQRVVSDCSDHFSPLETAIRTVLLPALFGGADPTEISPDLRSVLSLPIRHGGISLPDPTVTADTNHTTSSVCTALLTDSLLDGTELSLVDHQKCMAEGKKGATTERNATATADLAALLSNFPPAERRRLDRNQYCGAWISVLPTTVNGLSLSKSEWRDGMRRRYGLALQDLPCKCDGCGAKFTVEHALACKKGGLVVGRHDEVKAELGSIAMQALGSNRVRDEPKIQTGHATNPDSSATSQCSPSNKSSQQSSSSPATSPSNTHDLGSFFDRGDLLVHSFWDRTTACVFDTRVTDTDQPSYLGTKPAQVLLSQEKGKKKHYQELCFQERRHFTPYVVCTSGLLGKEAQETNKRLARLLALKWDTAYSATVGYVNARIGIAIQRAAHLCIRGLRVPFRHASSKIPLWDDGAGLRLLRT